AAEAACELGVARQAGVQTAGGIAADQAALLKHADAFANGRAVDTALAHQIMLGADGIAGLDAPIDDLALDGVGDFLIGRRDIDRTEERRNRHGSPQWRLSDKL